MNKKNLLLLNMFANNHSLATNVKVDISEYTSRYTPREKDSYTKYEEVTLLSGIVQGAEHFIYYLERNGYKIIKGKSK